MGGGGQIFRILGTRTDDARESTEERSERSRELVAADETTVFPKPLLDLITVEYRQGNRGLPNPPTPMRATGVRPRARSTILSIKSSRPRRLSVAGAGFTGYAI